MLLGAIADDFTGATDLANTLVRNGMRTVQLIGVPSDTTEIGDADAVIIALKTRTLPAADAVAHSLAALVWLRARGARQVLFKYCSTFDSTDAGNIGPVADALLDALGSDFTVYCPAFPENGRTIYYGYLFVGKVLLSESGMRDHPLTPMRDPSLVRVLSRQTPHAVGLVAHSTVAAGAGAIDRGFTELRTRKVRHAIVDALVDDDLRTLGMAIADLPLITGGSGIALGLPAAYRTRGWLAQQDDAAASLPADGGLAAVIAGSCSTATLAQVEAMRAHRPVFDIDPLALAAGSDVVSAALAWAQPLLADGPVLVSASALPERVAAIQQVLGREQAGALVEHALARIARGLVDAGVRRLVVAGGETSGAVVQALDVTALRIGTQIDPGVPWTVTVGRTPELALALKSGNFGASDFFLRALAAP